MNRLLYLAMIAGLILAPGCRGGDDDDGGDPIDAGGNDVDAAGNDTDAAPPPDCSNGTPIQDVQNVSMPPDTPVALCDVVVTAIDRYGQFQNTIFVQEPEGGEFSGIMIYFNDAPLPQGIEVGDLVNVTNVVKTEFALISDTSGRTMTELVAGPGQAIAIEDLGVGTVPAPAIVDPIVLAADDNEAEKWESVLIQFNDVALVSTVARMEDSAHANVTGPFEVQGNFTEEVSLFQLDTCYQSMVGVLDYFSGFQLLPRSASDLVAGGTNCPPPETGDVLCNDGMDNDHNGFMDCLDFDCQASVPACVPTTSVVMIQDGTIAENTMVTLETAIVTGLSRDREHFWVMDNAPAGEYNGIYVYNGGDATPQPPEVGIGTVMQVQGRVTEYQTYTELTNTSLTPTGATVTPVAITGVTTGTLGVDATNEPYEGTLVELNNVRVTMIEIDNFGSFLVDDGSGELRVGDWSYDYPSPAVDDCYASLTGIMHRFSTGVSFSPRSAEDMVLGGTCN